MSMDLLDGTGIAIALTKDMTYERKILCLLGKDVCAKSDEFLEFSEDLCNMSMDLHDGTGVAITLRI